MLFKTMNHLVKSTTSSSTLQLLGVRMFASSSKTFQSGGLNENFNFPKHKEFFNDKYYDTEDNHKSPYSEKATGPKTLSDDFIDPNNPFVTENPFVPGGILASYKKRLNLTP